MKLLLVLLATTAQADEYVNGYYRQDGTYVEGHYRTHRHQQRWDNYSSEGNTNPWTGEKGYEQHEYSEQPAFNQGYQPRGGRPSSYR